MQAKIIDLASDKIVNALHKIDKNDVRKVMTNVSSKVASKKSQGSMHPGPGQVKNSEEYCAMVKNEFTFVPQENRGKEKKDCDTKLSLDDSLLKSETVDEKSFEFDESLPKSSQNNEDILDLCKPEVNRRYQNEVQSFVQKKNIAQGMMDLALLSSNCNQLRYVLDMNTMHPYYLTSLILIGTSLALQIIVGLGLLYQNGYNLKREMKSANRFSNLSIIGVFFITIINVLIATFNGTNLSMDPNSPSNSTFVTTTSIMPY